VLTRQLLAMSRKQVLELRVIDVNEVISDFHGMLRRLTREDIEIELRLAPDVGRVRADASQINQVVMNLALNAADAMEHGGRLCIETANVELAADANTRTPIPPGPYVALSVSDTGAGIEAETLERIFDPFFTTKERGRGTGLGLATVLGIASQHGGSTSVESRTGEGSTFRVYLPRVDEALGAGDFASEEERGQRGSETILVMEDQEMVRKFSQTVLSRHGYEVLAPANVEEALELARSHRGPIHLLLTDVIMPGMNGSALWERLRSDRPQLKVLFMSGYTDDVIAPHGVEEAQGPFLQKPFSVKRLTEKVRMALDAAG
jgi:CheY-like chemotaxis protein